MRKPSRNRGGMQQGIVDWADRTVEVEGHHRVLGVLARFCDRNATCFPSMALIAHRAGVSVRQARRAVASLEEAGLVLRVERKLGVRMGNRSNVYVLIGAPAWCHSGHWTESQWAPLVDRETRRRRDGLVPRPGFWGRVGEMSPGQIFLRDARRWPLTAPRSPRLMSGGGPGEHRRAGGGASSVVCGAFA